MEYPSESLPSLYEEDGGEFPALCFAGCVLEGLPLGCEVDTLGVMLGVTPGSPSVVVSENY